MLDLEWRCKGANAKSRGHRVYYDSHSSRYEKNIPEREWSRLNLLYLSGNTCSARQVLLCILRDVADSQIKPTAMITLLYATLACELECFGEEGKEVLEKICCCSLSSSNGELRK